MVIGFLPNGHLTLPFKMECFVSTSMPFMCPRNHSNAWALHRNYSFLLFQSVLKMGYFFILHTFLKYLNLKLHSLWKRKCRNACYSSLLESRYIYITTLCPTMCHKDNISIHMVEIHTFQWQKKQCIWIWKIKKSKKC